MNSTPRLQACIGAEMKRLRIARNLSLRDFAELAGIGKAQLCRMEKGHINLTLETMVYVCNGLGVDVADFFHNAINRQAAVESVQED